MSLQEWESPSKCIQTQNIHFAEVTCQVAASQSRSCSLNVYGYVWNTNSCFFSGGGKVSQKLFQIPLPHLLGSGFAVVIQSVDFFPSTLPLPFQFEKQDNNTRGYGLFARHWASYWRSRMVNRTEKSLSFGSCRRHWGNHEPNDCLSKVLRGATKEK